MGVYTLLRNLCGKNRLSIREQALPLNTSAANPDIARQGKSHPISEHPHREDDPSYCPEATDNRRKEERIATAGDVYVLTDTKPQILGQMVEISSGGLAFTFIDLDQASQGLANRISLQLDLFAHGRGHYVRNLPCRLVSKIVSNDPQLQSPKLINRVGVSFENLSIAQQVQVNSLMRRNRGRR